MTLAELIRKAREIGDKFPSYNIGLVDDDWYDVDIDLEIVQDEDDKQYYVKVIQEPKYD